jgi:nitric oxide reductase subunit C
MTERAWQRTFLWGTAFFVVLLTAMSVDSLHKVNAGRTPPVSDQVARGKYLFQRRNCNDCHTILGIGGYYAPDLTKVADRRDAAWLLRFLADPAEAKPGTTMPDQRLTQAEAADVVAFLDWVGHIDTNGWPPTPLSRLGEAAAGAPGAAARPTPPRLFEAKGCSGCHAVDGRGASGPGPDLSHIGTTPYDGLANDADFLARFLEDPAAARPGTAMPKMPLSPAERDSLVQFLLALK